MALVNQQAASYGLPSVGFANPALYSIARSSSYGSSFHDVATGSCPCDASTAACTVNGVNASYNATAGYDLCTGLGSPTSNLIEALLNRVSLVGDYLPGQITDGNGGCLDLPSGNTTNGTLLHIWQCDSNGLNQTWFRDAQGSIHYGPNPLKCVDFPAQSLVNGVPTDETQLQIWDCNGHSGPDQMWTFTANHQIQFAADTEKCVELRNGSTANNTPVQVYDCNGTTGQTWYAIQGSPVQPIQLQDGNGACLQPAGGSAANGTLLQLEACSASGAEQEWYWDGYGSLHYAGNPAQCLDVPAQGGPAVSPPTCCSCRSGRATTGPARTS